MKFENNSSKTVTLHLISFAETKEDVDIAKLVLQSGKVVVTEFPYDIIEIIENERR